MSQPGALKKKPQTAQPGTRAKKASEYKVESHMAMLYKYK
jgi:hypothetical protein